MEEPSAHERTDGPLVLFVSSNGTGMGHITRLLALARRRSSGVRALFASMSSAVPVVAAPVGPGSEPEGFDWRYIPSRGDLGLGGRRWGRMLSRRLGQIVEEERPDLLVFDGVYPYAEILDRARRHDPPVVWSRRGMWRAGSGARQLGMSRHFSRIVEPGDLAADADPGLTAGRSDATRVDPVTLLDTAEHLPRAEAAGDLGLDPGRPAALVVLGAGTVEDIDSALGRVTTRLLAEPDLQVVVTRPVIGSEHRAHGDRLHGVSRYPISRHLAAFDLAVAASGYNAFHELVTAGVPTAFLPQRTTAMDDQVARARWADETGCGVLMGGADADSVDIALTELLARRDDIAARCRRVARPNGAAPAMQLVEQLLEPA